MLQLRYVPRLSVLIKADQVMIALDRGETEPRSSSAVLLPRLIRLVRRSLGLRPQCGLLSMLHSCFIHTSSAKYSRDKKVVCIFLQYPNRLSRSNNNKKGRFMESALILN